MESATSLDDNQVLALNVHLTHLTKHHLAKSHHMADLMQLQNKDLKALCAEYGLTNVHMAGTGRLRTLLQLSDAMVDRKS